MVCRRPHIFATAAADPGPRPGADGGGVLAHAVGIGRPDEGGAIVETRPPGHGVPAPPPLGGTRVVHLTRSMAGPFGAALLGGDGAYLLESDRPGAGDRAGFGQGVGGEMATPGEEGGAPVGVGVPTADVAGGMYAADAVVLALLARRRAGAAQSLGLSLLDAQISWLSHYLRVYLASGEI